MKNIYGYYLCDEKIFYSREAALDYMLFNNIFSENLSFYYHDDIFSSLNWTIPINFDISKIYAFRAKQLRDKYKYLILAFSGGSDSTQMLTTFIKNNIHIDEIQVYHHEKSTKKLDTTFMMRDNELSQFLEFELSVIPFLKKHSYALKDTKINLIDTSDFIVSQFNNSKFEMLGNNNKGIKSSCFIVPKMVRSFQYHMLQYNEKIIDKENVGIIKGIEKPHIVIHEDNMMFRFYDIAYQGVNNFNIKKMENFATIENFYWSADCPIIPIKQSQMIKERMENDKKFYLKYDHLKNIMVQHNVQREKGFSTAGEIERMFNSVIYPDWDGNTFFAPNQEK